MCVNERKKEGGEDLGEDEFRIYYTEKKIQLKKVMKKVDSYLISMIQNKV